VRVFEDGIDQAGGEATRAAATRFEYQTVIAVSPWPTTRG